MILYHITSSLQSTFAGLILSIIDIWFTFWFPFDYGHSLVRSTSNPRVLQLCGLMRSTMSVHEQLLTHETVISVIDYWQLTPPLQLSGYQLECRNISWNISCCSPSLIRIPGWNTNNIISLLITHENLSCRHLIFHTFILVFMTNVMTMGFVKVCLINSVVN
jgi:hypothetical protein